MTTLSQQNIDGVRVVSVSGSLTQQGVEAIERPFVDALPDGSRAVVDLADVDLITIPGLTLIVATTQRLRSTRGKVVFTAPKGLVFDLIKRCRLDVVLEMEGTTEQAVEKAKS